MWFVRVPPGRRICRVMTWVRSDDREDDRRDIKRAWRANGEALGLRSLARTMCARLETDGLVDLDWIEERVPDQVRREAILSTLVDNDLFEALPATETRDVRLVRTSSGKKVTFNIQYGPLDVDAYIMHDYLEHNEARVESEARRREQAKKKAEARAKKGERKPTNVPGDIDDCPEGQVVDNTDCPEDQGGVSLLSRPDPTRPDLNPIPNTPPNPPTGGRARDKDKWRKELSVWVEEHPVTDELLAVWAPLQERIADRFAENPGVLIALAELHPHQLGTVPVLGGPTGPVGLVSRPAQRVFDEVLGAECRLIDCQCDLSRERVV